MDASTAIKTVVERPILGRGPREPDASQPRGLLVAEPCQHCM